VTQNKQALRYTRAQLWTETERDKFIDRKRETEREIGDKFIKQSNSRRNKFITQASSQRYKFIDRLSNTSKQTSSKTCKLT
jgi:hypothetical protein